MLTAISLVMYTFKHAISSLAITKTQKCVFYNVSYLL